MIPIPSGLMLRVCRLPKTMDSLSPATPPRPSPIVSVWVRPSDGGFGSPGWKVQSVPFQLLCHSPPPPPPLGIPPTIPVEMLATLSFLFRPAWNSLSHSALKSSVLSEWIARCSVPFPS